VQIAAALKFFGDCSSEKYEDIMESWVSSSFVTNDF